MLGKLIKNEFNATWKLIIIFHSFLLFVSIIGRFFVIQQFRSSSPRISVLLYLCFYVFTIILISCATMFFVVARFYKNLFTDEGYLMFTLPVSSGQLLMSKTITGSLWMVFNMLLVYCSLAITFLTPSAVSWFKVNQTSMKTEFGFSWSYLLLILFLLSIIGCISSTLMLYLSIAVGQLFSKHRILVALLTYFGLTIALQLITTFALLACDIFPSVSINSTNISPKNYMQFIFGSSTIMSLALCLFSYLITYFIMKKKINLN